MSQLLADNHTEIGELQAQLGTKHSQMVAALALLIGASDLLGDYQHIHDIMSSFAECPCPECVRGDSIKAAIEGLKVKVGL